MGDESQAKSLAPTSRKMAEDLPIEKTSQAIYKAFQKKANTTTYNVFDHDGGDMAQRNS